MPSYPATTKIIKSGRSNRIFLLFTGNRKQSDDATADSVTEKFIFILMMAFATVACICIIYAFVRGTLG
ncbi:hypothetical protein [Tunturiibacter lichenicola]|jgi:hypothetical protein|uniref:hypothetical protein n=1 Tax=Tunturiibacter lichenicola TaxID=2051959 RepID=UPI003D9B8E6D